MKEVCVETFKQGARPPSPHNSQKCEAASIIVFFYSKTKRSKIAHRSLAIKGSNILKKPMMEGSTPALTTAKVVWERKESVWHQSTGISISTWHVSFLVNASTFSIATWKVCGASRHASVLDQSKVKEGLGCFPVTSYRSLFGRVMEHANAVDVVWEFHSSRAPMQNQRSCGPHFIELVTRMQPSYRVSYCMFTGTTTAMC